MADDKTHDPGGWNEKNVAASVTAGGFVQERFPGYDPKNFNVDIFPREGAEHLKPRRAFNRADAYGARPKDGGRER